VEGVVALGLCALVVAANFELVRRGVIELLLHHSAFLTVRAAVLGKGGAALAQGFRKSALGSVASEDFQKRILFQTTVFERAVRTDVYYRYPAWVRLPMASGIKAHFEVTRRCHFSWSR
jgi:hypothetical protein